MPDDITIRVDDDLPCDGMVLESPDGHSNIYVSGKLCKEKQQQVCLHEIAHVKYGHLHDDRDVMLLEEEANEYAANRKIPDLSDDFSDLL